MAWRQMNGTPDSHKKLGFVVATITAIISLAS
jgi:hypothetical protein